VDGEMRIAVKVVVCILDIAYVGFAGLGVKSELVLFSLVFHLDNNNYNIGIFGKQAI
jgi:hypothetical protein